jgi:hypothetical protein
MGLMSASAGTMTLWGHGLGLPDSTFSPPDACSGSNSQTLTLIFACVLTLSVNTTDCIPQLPPTQGHTDSQLPDCCLELGNLVADRLDLAVPDL